MTYNNYVSTFQRESKSMSKEIRKINPELAKKFLERERRLGVSIGILTVLFFLVYCPTIALRKVSFEPNNNSLCQVIISNIYTIEPGLQYFGIFIKQIAPNARITHPTATLVCSIINWSIGIIDPLVYLIRRKEFREEVKNLFILKVSPKKTGMAKGIVLESPLKY